MTRETLALVAIDLGASSGRVILGRVGPDTLDLTEVHRFRNGPVQLPDGLYWDILGLYQDVLEGLRAAVRRSTAEGLPLAGAAIDSWAVDYGLVDTEGRLAANPRHYRDPRSRAGVERVHRMVDADRLYAVNGLQFLPFNTVYQFATESELAGRQALLIPDLLGYWLTGRRVAEETNASTTGLLDATTGAWSEPLLRELGLPSGLLPDVVRPGEVIGAVTSTARAAVGLDGALAVTAVGSHDTASAVVGVPADQPNFGYISCGTWGLVGVELGAPAINAESRAANFTNERGVDGTIRYLRNVMGLWLLSESIRTWKLRGYAVDLATVLAGAAELPAGGPRFDPDDPVFLPPGDMPARIEQACQAGGRRPPTTILETVRCILDSLAAAFVAAIQDAERCSGRRVDIIHVVGGGAQNALLCQLVADISKKTVVAGPVEATAIGNLLVQARTHGALSGDIFALRDLVRRTQHLVTYRPSRAFADRT